MKAANKSIEILSLASTSGTLMVVSEDSQQEHDTQRTTRGGNNVTVVSLSIKKLTLVVLILKSAACQPTHFFEVLCFAQDGYLML